MHALATFDDGSGPALYAGGSFTSAGHFAVGRVARWDGRSWSALGSGVSSPLGWAVVNALTTIETSSGPALFAGGDFDLAGGLPAASVARWDGASWSALGGGIDGFVEALAGFDDGSGEALVAGGLVYHPGSGSQRGLAQWRDSGWEWLGSGPDGEVHAALVHDDGSGAAVYVGGDFAIGGVEGSNHVARWDGRAWSALGVGTDGTVQCLAVHDDGQGTALYAGGGFDSAGGAPAGGFAVWDGADWTAPAGVDLWGVPFAQSSINALIVFDDGSGSALYAGGWFNVAGGVAVSNVARWSGGRWTAVGAGWPGTVYSFAVHEVAGVPTLIAAGGGVAKWDGTRSTSISGGLAGTVMQLQVFDDGKAPALYAGGSLGLGVQTGIARWDGLGWTAMGQGLVGYARALAVFDDGSGPALFAGGYFEAAGGAPSSGVARFDGASWAALDASAFDDVYGGAVNVLAVVDAGEAPALLAGGEFAAGPSGDSHLALWGVAPPSPWSDLGGGLAGSLGIPALHGSGALTPGSAGTLALEQGAPGTLASVFVSVTSTPQPFHCGTLVPLPFVLMLLLATDGAGCANVGWSAWPAGLAGAELFWQAVLVDPLASCGLSISNALRADVP
ncbi:MAG TPA: hypothetical protein VFD43_10985 [Planctomycetota bacterium]|nr:hypothetical protein [Planctomycetota bacterium]